MLVRTARSRAQKIEAMLVGSVIGVKQKRKREKRGGRGKQGEEEGSRGAQVQPFKSNKVTKV